MKKRNIIPILIYIAVIAIALTWLAAILDLGGSDLTYSHVVELFEKKQVKEFKVEDDRIYLVLHEPLDGESKLVATLANVESFRNEMWDTIQTQHQEGILEAYDFLPQSTWSPFDFIWPMLIVGLVILLLWAIIMGRMNSNHPMANFGRARTTLGIGNNKKVSFDDVAGADEEKQELQEAVDFLRNPEKYTQIGARIPHGLLLVGPPGTGKTLLARATAGEADVAFLSISGSDFMEMYVGVGASRVRDLFDQAKRVAPAIIFIDEIDAVGRQRGTGMGGGHDEREQTLNQLLVEMDGFGHTEGVIVMAATNRADILDPALLRPGRFDRQIYVGVPDAKGRQEILKVHARGKKLDDSVDLRTVALSTPGFTGADLSNLMNEAAIMAARDNRPVLNMKDLNDAMMKIMAGPEKRSRTALPRDLRITAIHEAGHAVAMYSLPTHDPVQHISIIPRGQALGITWSMPREDTMHLTRNEMYEQIVGLLGGRVAEALFLGDISTGASNDIDRATKLARDMVSRYGMCENLGTVSYASSGELFIGRDYQSTKSYSEKVAATIDDEVKALVDQAYDHCARILKQDEQKFQTVVEFLLKHETMTGAQFAACMQGEPIPEESGDTILFDGAAEE